MSNCIHFWVIESPDGEMSEGICKYCGERKTFRNFLVPQGLLQNTRALYVPKGGGDVNVKYKHKAKETYTYGDDIDKQLKELIRVHREGEDGTNQACMSIGDANSIFLEHSQCLRVIDTRIRYGKLHFYVYFRSWDLWGGFPANLAAVQVLKEYVGSELGVEDGELIAYSKGLHLYDMSWDVANMVLGRS